MQTMELEGQLLNCSQVVAQTMGLIRVSIRGLSLFCHQTAYHFSVWLISVSN